jgi:uroporphyrinogen-III synthase
MMSHCVLLTRPRGFNDRLSRMLTQSGIRSLERPMFEIEPCEVTEAQKGLAINLDQFDYVIFVSKNAVRYGACLLERYWPQWPQVEWLAVGKATGEDLEPFGIRAVYPNKAGSEGLLNFQQLKDVADCKVMIVRGVGGRELLAGELSHRGAKVSYLESYARIEIAYGEALASDLFEYGVDLVVATSEQGLRHLIASLSVQEIATLNFVVPSRRIARLAEVLGCTQVFEANGADDESIVQSILKATLLM